MNETEGLTRMVNPEEDIASVGGSCYWTLLLYSDLQQTLRC
jgi:hypothetical protein